MLITDTRLTRWPLPAAAAVLWATALLIAAVPSPSLVPLPGTWQLDFEVRDLPQRITLHLPGWDRPRAFWFFPYTVINNTGREVDFYPSFTLLTNTFRVYPANVALRQPVFEVVRARYADAIPLLEPEENVTGRLLVGPDNARDSVALFEEFDPNARAVRVFVGGLSNETVTVPSPAETGRAGGKPKEFLLRKTLMLEYQAPGDAFDPDQRVMLYRGREWVMR